ncbi:TetR/AcrR family transcriptional regulator [Nocardioides humilatus]|uniref:TetR/AcrR family transcriptional regulator n=1 Tax=Nocardioides humilatus TaxID=2607660 RepID=UPI00165F6ABE|nr:TetR family transcriptional regulator [Nocardioides humilatus]
MAEAVRPYRGVSAEERRTLRRSQLLEACLDVVGEVGVAATTAEAICARAGLSKRYFYETFTDRDEVLVAALDVFFESARIAILPALAATDATADERLTGTVAALVASVSADPRTARLYVESSRNVALEQRRIAAYDVFADLLLEHAFDIGVEPHGPRARTVALLIVSGTTEVVARWLSGDLDLDEAGLVDAISGVGIAAAAALSDSRPAPSRRP